MHVPEHGEFDSETKQWFCGYWMSKQVWMDVHHYSPPSAEEKWRKRQMKAFDIIEATISCISKLGNNLILKGK